MTQKIAARLVRAQRTPILGRAARGIASLWSIDIPPQVEIGADFRLEHRGQGVVINPNTIIGDHVTVYHNVTIAREDSWIPTGGRPHEPVVIEDDVVLCPGTVIIFGERGLRVGRGTILGANSTLTRSTGDWEVWAGAPARKLSDRKVSVAELDQLASSRKGLEVPT